MVAGQGHTFIALVRHRSSPSLVHRHLPLSKSQIAHSVMHHPVFEIIFQLHSVNLVYHLSPPSHHPSLPLSSISDLKLTCSVWHSSLTVGQHEALESLKKRAMRIISNHDDYLTSLIIAGIDNLQTRREHLTEQFFSFVTFSRNNHLYTTSYLLNVTSTLLTDSVTLKHLNSHNHELRNSENHSFHIVSQISNRSY